MKKFILQAVTAKSHFDEVCNLLEIEAAKKIIISTAYMRETGLRIIANRLQRVAEITELFVGIRNGVTSAQALKIAINLGCSVYVVDTGMSKKIFHPKMYFGLSENFAKIIIGSANLTLGGLHSNIEASIIESLDIKNEVDKKLVDEITECYNKMKSDHSENVLHITCKEKIDELLATGQIIDENIDVPPLGVANSHADNIPKMKLQTASLPINIKNPSVSALSSDNESYKFLGPSGFYLVWESLSLTRRDLNIPTGPSTNPTGSMLWKKGAWDINQQEYFRDKVFHKLNWKSDPKKEGKEEAEADFDIKIRGILYPRVKLTVTNDTRKNTTSYKQHQPMSALRWGEISSLIADEDLLDRTLRLYRSHYNETLFLIDID